MTLSTTHILPRGGDLGRPASTASGRPSFPRRGWGAGGGEGKANSVPGFPGWLVRRSAFRKASSGPASMHVYPSRTSFRTSNLVRSKCLGPSTFAATRIGTSQAAVAGCDFLFRGAVAGQPIPNPVGCARLLRFFHRRTSLPTPCQGRLLSS